MILGIDGWILRSLGVNKLVFAVVFFSSFNLFSQEPNRLQFSHLPGLYPHGFYLKVSPLEEDILFLSEDSVWNKMSVFPDSMLIDQTRTLSFSVKSDGGNREQHHYSYFIDFHTKFKIVSLSIQNDFLFDQTKGIYVNGPLAYYDSAVGYYRNTNFERKWERETYVELFDEEANRLIAQQAGLRIFGGMTKYYPEKSLRLISRKEYGTGRFNADIFNEGKKKYKQFVLRHSGNDYRSTRFKDALLTSLAAESGLDVMRSSPAHLFVNSEYWGVYNVREKINQFYIRNHHDIPDEGIDILEMFKTVDTGSPNAYEHLLKFIETNNLADRENYIMVQSMMDVQNFAKFWIHQIFYANQDARGNIRFWRSDVSDGRFRWIVYDTDLGFAVPLVNLNLLRDFTSEQQTEWYNPPWATFILRNLLRNKDFEHYFINQFSFILSTTLSENHMLEKIDEFQELYEPEMKTHFEKRKRFQPHQGNFVSWHNSVDELRSFAKRRPKIMHAHFTEKFNLGKPFIVKVQVQSFNNGVVEINNNELKDSTFCGMFYTDCSIPIKIDSDFGFSHEGFSDDEIFANGRDTVEINIEFTQNEESQSRVIFNEVDFSTNSVELFNTDSGPINIDGWKLLVDDVSYEIRNKSSVDSRFLVLTGIQRSEAIQSATTFKLPFSLSQKSNTISLYDGHEKLVDQIKLDQKAELVNYSRSVSLSAGNSETVTWKINEPHTLGEQNQQLHDADNYRTWYSSFGRNEWIIILIFSGISAASVLVFFIIKKSKSTMHRKA